MLITPCTSMSVRCPPDSGFLAWVPGPTGFHDPAYHPRGFVHMQQ